MCVCVCVCVCILSADGLALSLHLGLVGGVLTVHVIDYGVLWLIRCTTPCVMLSTGVVSNQVH